MTLYVRFHLHRYWMANTSEQAADMTQLNAHLLPPLAFTHTPHHSAPIRGSPPIATRHIQHPRSGREHLILTFWVHGRGIGEEETLGWAKTGYHTAVGWARGLGELMGLVDPAATQPVPVTTSAGTPQTEKAQGDALEGAGSAGCSVV